MEVATTVEVAKEVDTWAGVEAGFELAGAGVALEAAGAVEPWLGGTTTEPVLVGVSPI